MKPRATTHSGKGSVKHNFREYPAEAKGKSDIDRTLSSQNKFFINGKFFNSLSEMKEYLSENSTAFQKQAERFKDDSRYKDLTLSQKFELMAYEKYFGGTIKAQHQRNASRRQQCLNKNAIDMITNQKTQPEESIFQIGDIKNCPNPISADELWQIYKDYQKRHNSKFGKYIKIIDSSLHTDEKSYHIHERKIFIGKNSHGEYYPGKDSALSLLEIQRPDITKAKSRFNNRKQAYSTECRQIWLDVCKEHGLDIETTPLVYADKRGLELTAYKVQQEEKKLQFTREQTDKALSNLKSVNTKLNQQSNEYSRQKQLNEELAKNVIKQQEIIKRNNSMLRSQESTIETNKKILKKLEQKKQSLKEDMDDMAEQVAELDGRMNILYSEYNNDYRTVDENAYISNRLKEEYPDYFKEVMGEFQATLPEHEEIEI